MAGQNNNGSEEVLAQIGDTQDTVKWRSEMATPVPPPVLKGIVSKQHGERTNTHMRTHTSTYTLARTRTDTHTQPTHTSTSHFFFHPFYPLAGSLRICFSFLISRPPLPSFPLLSLFPLFLSLARSMLAAHSLSLLYWDDWSCLTLCVSPWGLTNGWYQEVARSDEGMYIVNMIRGSYRCTTAFFLLHLLACECFCCSPVRFLH